MGSLTLRSLLHACRLEKRALFTVDVDFADIRNYPPEDFYGLIVLRLNNQAQPHVLETVRHLLPILSKEPFERRLWIVEEHGVRIRG